jgi:hypothetical protein
LPTLINDKQIKNGLEQLAYLHSLSFCYGQKKGIDFKKEYPIPYKKFLGLIIFLIILAFVLADSNQLIVKSQFGVLFYLFFIKMTLNFENCQLF